MLLLLLDVIVIVAVDVSSKAWSKNEELASNSPATRCSYINCKWKHGLANNNHNSSRNSSNTNNSYDLWTTFTKFYLLVSKLLLLENINQNHANCSIKITQHLAAVVVVVA